MATDRPTKFLLAAGVVGAPLFVAVFLIDGATRPGYDPTYHPVSALSLGDRGWVQVTNFVVNGLLTLVFAVGLRRALRPGPAALFGPLLVGAFGLAIVLAGVFRMDPMRGYPTGAPPGDPAEFSWQHQLHDLVSVAAFLALPLACFVLARRFAARPPRYGWLGYCVATGLAGLLLLGWFGVAWEADHDATGLIQRFMIIVYWGWVAVLALGMLAGRQVRSPLTIGA